MDNSQSKFIIVNEANEYVDIYLYGTIGSYWSGNKVDGDYIADQIRQYDDQKFHIINEHINSDGGEITNGLSIVAANLGCKNAKIHTYNDGVAASMAGVIHQTGSKKFAAPHSQFMMHEPSMSGETIETTTDPIVKKRLQAAKEQLVAILVSATGLSNEKIEEMMSQETWLNATECEKMGFVTKGCIVDVPNMPVIKRGIKPKDILVLVNKAFKNLNNNQMAQTKCEKCGEEFDFKEHKIENENAATCPGCKTKVDKEGKKITGQVEPLEAKTEPVVDVATFTKLSDQVTSLTNLVNGLKSENEVLKAESAASKKTLTASILDKAIEEGKIVSTAREDFLKEYALNPEGLRKIVDSIPMPHNSILGKIDPSKDAVLPGGFKTLREMEKGNPQMAERFARENPVAYDKFYQIEYK